MTTNSWMTDLAAQLGINAISFDAEGRAGVQHPAGIELEIHADNDRHLIHLCARVAPIPVLDTAAHLQRLLQQTALRRGADEPAFAIERESRGIVLSLSLPENGVEATMLANAIRLLVERCTAARTELSRIGS